MYLIELVGLLTGLGLDRVWHGDLLHKLKSYGISGRYLTLFLLFSVIDSFKWFWMESLHKNIQLILEFLKAPFLVLHFSCCMLMTFLMMLSVILLSMLTILLSVLSDQASDLWQKLELVSELESLYLCKSTICPCMEYCWNTGIVPLVATWNCYTNYKNEYAGLLVLHLLLLLNPWLIAKTWPTKVFSISITLVNVLQNWLNCFRFLFLKGGLIDCMIFLSPFLDVTRMSLSTVFFRTS